MGMEETIKRLIDCGVIAVIRGNSPEDAEKTAIAASEGGIVGLEVTFTVPGAEKVIADLAKKQNAPYIVGAGTVLDEKTALVAIEAGAKLIVGPNFDMDICKLCKARCIPYVAGVFTVNEIVMAMKEGVEILKIFPGSAASPDYIKAIHGPLPNAKLMPTGGVDLDNVAEWIKKGAVAVGIGSNLTAPAKKGDFAEVTRLASLYVQKVAEARK